MGLDNFASRSSEDIELNEEDYKAFEKANIELCGGMLSGGGNDGSFRGKVYILSVLEITGESLSEEWIPAETVQKMYTDLEAYIAQSGEEQLEGLDNSLIELQELCKFFRICADRGLSLIGWA